VSFDVHRERLETEARVATQCKRAAMSDDLANGDVAYSVRVRAGSKYSSRDGEIHSRRDNTRTNEVHGVAIQA